MCCTYSCNTSCEVSKWFFMVGRRTEQSDSSFSDTEWQQKKGDPRGIPPRDPLKLHLLYWRTPFAFPFIFCLLLHSVHLAPHSLFLVASILSFTQSIFSFPFPYNLIASEHLSSHLAVLWAAHIPHFCCSQLKENQQK